MASTRDSPGPEFPSTWARLDPDKPAVVVLEDGGEPARTLTYAELDQRSLRLARLLHADGLAPGRHIAVLMENRAELFEVCWAAKRSGLYVTVVNTRLNPAEAAYVVRDCGAEALVTSAALGELAAAIVDGTPGVRRRLVVGGELAGHEDYLGALTAVSDGPAPPECEGDTMLYSSGTTGLPKGVKRPLTLAPPGGEFRLRPLLAAMGYGRDTVYLSPAPLYHAAPLGYSMAVHRFGGTVVVMPRFDAEGALRAIQRHRVTHAQFVPTMFIRMLKLPEPVRAGYDHSGLRSVVHAAAPCRWRSSAP